MPSKHIRKAIGSLFFVAIQTSFAQEVSFKEVEIPKPLVANGHFTSPTTLMSLSGGGDTLSALDQPNEVLFNSIGRGYNPFTQKMGVVCVENIAKDEELDGAVMRTFMDTVSDEKSMAHAGGSAVSVGAMFKAVSIGAGTSSTNSSMFNHVDRYARVYSRIATKNIHRGDIRWKKEIEDMLIANKIGEFLDTCGTRFVRTVYAGHLLDETVHFTMNDESNSTASATTVSLSVGKLFGGSGSFCDAQSSVTAVATTKLQSYGLGALALPTLPSPGGGGAAPTSNAPSQTASPAPAPAESGSH